MKRWLSPSLFVIVCSMMLTAPAQAGTSFGGKCSFDPSGTHLNCFFDALRGDYLGNPGSGSSCASGTPQYLWEFGDLTTSGTFSYNNLVGHQYPLPVVSGTEGYPYGYFVTLRIRCPEGEIEVTRYICIYGFGVAGCINTSGNWR